MIASGLFIAACVVSFVCGVTLALAMEGTSAALFQQFALPSMERIGQLAVPLPLWAAVLDIVAVVLFIAYAVGGVRAWRKVEGIRMSDAERQLAGTAVGSTVTTVMTANSILLAGVTILLGWETVQVGEGFTFQLTLSAFWFVIAVITGMVTSGYVLNHVHHRSTLAENVWVAGSANVLFSLTMTGASFLLIALCLIALALL